MPLIVIPDDAPPVLSLSDAVGRLGDCDKTYWPSEPGAPIHEVM